MERQLSWWSHTERAVERGVERAVERAVERGVERGVERAVEHVHVEVVVGAADERQVDGVHRKLLGSCVLEPPRVADVAPRVGLAPRRGREGAEGRSCEVMEGHGRPWKVTGAP